MTPSRPHPRTRGVLSGALARLQDQAGPGGAAEDGKPGVHLRRAAREVGLAAGSLARAAPGRPRVGGSPTPRSGAGWVPFARDEAGGEVYWDSWSARGDTGTSGLVTGAAGTGKSPAAGVVARGDALPLARDDTGREVCWNLATQPHGLLLAAAGEGATNAVRVLALEAARRGLEVQACDPKRVELTGLRGWPGVTRIATQPADMVDLVDDAHRVMHQRLDRLEQQQTRGRDLPRMLVILDGWELLTRLAREHRKAAGARGEPPVGARVRELAAVARPARVHLLLVVRRLPVDLLGADVLDNFGFRASLSPLPPAWAFVMWGGHETGTDLPRGPGQAMVGTPSGPRRARVYRASDPAYPSADQGEGR